MTSIITGSTSFIGLAVIEKLIKNNEKVIAIVRPNSSRINCIMRNDKIKVVESELQNIESLDLKIDNCNTFYHIGWSSDFDNHRFNLNGQLKNVEYAEKAAKLAARYGCDTFVSVGSQAECGRINGCITPYTPPKPETAYAIAKVILHERLKEFCEKNGMKFCSPRLLSGYGPYDRAASMMMACVLAGIKNIPMETSPGEQIWDYIYVDDIANALYLIAKKGIHAKRYPIGSGIARSMRSYIYEIAELTGGFNLLEGIGKRDYNARQVMNLLADITELREDTGFVCNYSFTEGIKRTIQFAKQIPEERK